MPEIAFHSSRVAGWDISPAGFTGRACPQCLRYFTPSEILEMERTSGSVSGNLSCIHCGFTSTSDSAHIGVRSDALRFFDESDVRASHWYHATLMTDWHNSMLRSESIPLVHLGNKDAALSRARHLSSYLGGGHTWTLYTITINNDAIIAPIVLEDEDDDAPSLAMKNRKVTQCGYELGGITRYVNRYESEGPISLLANPIAFRVSSQEVYN